MRKAIFAMTACAVLAVAAAAIAVRPSIGEEDEPEATIAPEASLPPMPMPLPAATVPPAPTAPPPVWNPPAVNVPPPAPPEPPEPSAPPSAAPSAPPAPVPAENLGPPISGGPLRRIATVSVPGQARDVFLAGGRACVATTTGLSTLDVSNPAAPRVLASMATGGGANNGVEVQAGHAFLANMKDGLVVVNIASMKVVARSPVTGKTIDVAVKGNAAYTVDFHGPMVVYDVSNPASPRVVKKLGLPEWRGNSAKENSAIAAGTASQGGSKLTGCWVEGNRFFACAYGYGRHYYFDVSNSLNPVFKGTGFADYVINGASYGDNLYTVAGYSSLSGVYRTRISEMSPSKSTAYFEHLGAPALDMLGVGISADGRAIAWAGGKGGYFKLMDVTGKMKVIGEAETGRHGVPMPYQLGVKFSGDHIFVAAGDAGVQVYEYPGLSSSGRGGSRPPAPPATSTPAPPRGKARTRPARK